MGEYISEYKAIIKYLILITQLDYTIANVFTWFYDQKDKLLNY